MKMVWAVIRSDKISTVARRLKKIGVSGCTVFPVRGYGEEWRLYEPLIHGGHHKLEAIVDSDQADGVVKEIVEHASTGLSGDGILAVFDLGSVLKIRSKEELKSSLDRPRAESHLRLLSRE
jgi:nitrogen regulatory protein P-II 1